MDNEDVILFNKTNKNKKEIELLKIDNLENKNDILSLNDEIDDINDSILELQNNSGGSGGFDPYTKNEIFEDWVPRGFSPSYYMNEIKINEDFIYNSVPSSAEPVLTALPIRNFNNNNEYHPATVKGALMLSVSTPTNLTSYMSVYNQGARFADNLKTEFKSKVAINKNLIQTGGGQFNTYKGITLTTNPYNFQYFIGFRFITDHSGTTVFAMAQREHNSVSIMSYQMLEVFNNPNFFIEDFHKYSIVIENRDTAKFYIDGVLWHTINVSSMLKNTNPVNLGMYYTYSVNMNGVASADSGSITLLVDTTHIIENQIR